MLLLFAATASEKWLRTNLRRMGISAYHSLRISCRVRVRTRLASSCEKIFRRPCVVWFRSLTIDYVQFRSIMTTSNLVVVGEKNDITKATFATSNFSKKNHECLPFVETKSV